MNTQELILVPLTDTFYVNPAQIACMQGTHERTYVTMCGSPIAHVLSQSLEATIARLQKHFQPSANS